MGGGTDYWDVHGPNIGAVTLLSGDIWRGGLQGGQAIDWEANSVFLWTVTGQPTSSSEPAQIVSMQSRQIFLFHINVWYRYSRISTDQSQLWRRKARFALLINVVFVRFLNGGTI